MGMKKITEVDRLSNFREGAYMLVVQDAALRQVPVKIGEKFDITSSNYDDTELRRLIEEAAKSGPAGIHWKVSVEEPTDQEIGDIWFKVDENNGVIYYIPYVLQEGGVYSILNLTNEFAYIDSIVELKASDWSESEPYRQDVPIEAVTTVDTPIISVCILESDSKLTVKNMNKSFSMIDRAVSQNGSIAFYCHNKKPAYDVRVHIFAQYDRQVIDGTMDAVARAKEAQTYAQNAENSFGRVDALSQTLAAQSVGISRQAEEAENAYTKALESANNISQYVADAKGYADDAAESEEIARTEAGKAESNAQNALTSAESAAQAETKAKDAQSLSESASEESARYSLIAQRYAQGLDSYYPGSSTDNARYYSERAKTFADNAQAVTGVGIATDYIAGLVKPDGVTIKIDDGGVLSTSSKLATVNNPGYVRPDGDTIIIDDDGTIHGVSPLSFLANPESAGIVKPDNETILIDESGVISCSVEVDTATPDTLGIVKPDGETITIDEDGTLHGTVGTATAETAGIVKPDGQTISIDANGVISLPFRFGIADDGRYGYIKDGADTVIPFKSEADLVGTATAAQVLSGFTFHNTDFNVVDGSMTNNGAWTAKPSSSGQQSIPAGYHDGNGYVDTSDVYNSGVSAVQNNPNSYYYQGNTNNGTLYTKAQYDTNYNNGREQGRTDVRNSPGSYYYQNNSANGVLYTKAQYDANYNSGRTQGQNDVKNSPNSYSLYTSAQYTANYNSGVTAGKAAARTSLTITANHSSYSNFTGYVFVSVSEYGSNPTVKIGSTTLTAVAAAGSTNGYDAAVRLVAYKASGVSGTLSISNGDGKMYMSVTI